MSIELGVVPWSEQKLVILSVMFHDGLDASDGHARVEYIEFQDSHPMMDMQDQLIKINELRRNYMTMLYRRIIP